MSFSQAEECLVPATAKLHVIRHEISTAVHVSVYGMHSCWLQQIRYDRESDCLSGSHYT